MSDQDHDRGEVEFGRWPDGVKALGALAEAVNGSDLGAPLIELIRLRASQLNGCGFCVDMHTRDALAAGETPARLEELDGWRSSTAFDDRERAALTFTETLTRLDDKTAHHEAAVDAAMAFTPVELTQLLWAVIEINAWNRLMSTVRPSATPD